MMRMPNADQVREIMGAVNPNSTVERKAANKAAKANYAAELQAQMRANEEAKQRDRAERMGLNRAPSYNNQGMPPPGPMGGMGGGGPPSPGGGGGMGGGGGSFGMQPQSFGGPPPQQQFGGLQPPYGPPIQAWGPPPPPPYQPPQYQGGPPPFQPPPFQPPGGSFGMPGSPGHSPPPNMFGGPPGGGYGPPPPNYGPPPPNYQNNFGGPPPQQQQQQQQQQQMPLLPGPIPPPGAPGANTMMRMEQQAKKANYAAELQAQMRANEERKAAEKAARMHEDMRKDAEMAAYAARGGGFGGGGRGGGGAPHRDAAGNIVADLAQMHRMGGGPGGPPPPGMNMGMNMGMGGGGGGMMNGGGPMGGMGGMGMGGPPMMGMGGGPMGGMGMGGPMSPGGGGGMGGPPGGPMGGPAGFMGGPGGPMEGGPGAPMPNFRFRSDNAYLTPNELNSKQQQARELQEALERQIQEKKMAKEMEKQRELAEIAREEARLRADNAALSAQQAAEAGGDKGGKDVVVDAWEKARLEAEEAKAKKFAAKRGGGAAAASPGAGGGGGWGEGPPFGPPGGEGGGGPPGPPPGPPPPPPGQDEFFGQLAAAVGAQPPPPQQHMGGGRPGTPLVAEKVRQVAAAELAQVKQELAAEAAQLREVVAAQGQTVAALKSHADRMEAEAERAKEQVAAMRINMIRRSVEEPEHILRVMADYDRPVPVVPGAPSLMDIGLDLPPTGAALRRSAAPPPVYDMGAVVPLHANHTALMMDNAAASAINANAAAGAASGVGVTAGGGGARPPTMGLRTVNPLEASMAAESVFIYPNGREMGRYVNAAAAGAGGGGGAAGGGGGAMGGRMTPPGLGLSQGAPPGGVPTRNTSQALETGPVPRTPPGLGLQSSALGAAVLGGPAAAGGGLHRQLSANARLRGAAAATPVDVDLVMHRNQDKLAMLKNMTDLAAGASAGASIEALDDFLARYASQRPGLPERTVTPVLRIHTPQVETITHGAAAPPAAAVAAPGAGGASGSPAAPVPLYSSRANSVGPLPMGGGRVLSAGSGPSRPGGSTAGSQPGTPGSSGAAAAAGLQRRNSFTGDRTLQEGVLSQLQTPPRSPAPGPTGAPGSAGVGSHGGVGGSRPVSGLRAASPLAGRPPIMPNTRYSNNGSTLGSANGGSRPGSSLVAQAAAKSPAVPGPPGSASAAGTPPRSALGHNVIEHGGSFTDGASEWPSYNPSRAATQHGPRPGADGAAVAASQLLSRSRSMSAASEGLGSRPPSVPPLPEDSLDAEMRKGLGSRPGTGQSGIAAAAAAAQGPHGAGGSRPASGQSALAAASAFPRSPILAGRLNRIGSAGGRPDITGSPSHVVS